MGTKGPDPRIRIIEVGIVWILLALGPGELSVIERCQYFVGVSEESLDCKLFLRLHDRTCYWNAKNVCHRVTAKF